MKPGRLFYQIIFLVTFVFVFHGEVIAQGGYWTWMKGDTINNSPGNFGIQGVADPLNLPPALYEPCEWTAPDGTFWMFGGTDTAAHFYADLWKYDPFTNMWTWMKGPGLKNFAGNYGTMGVADTANLPPSRGHGITSWIDNAGNFWMYGGRSIFNMLDHSDIWKYEIATNTWTWMNGATTNGATVYGTKNVSSPNNQPGSRAETSSSWVDANGKLWFFGGFKLSTLTRYGDLWKYDPVVNEWTWMHGTNLPTQFNYSVGMGIADTANIPGSRIAYCSWKDGAGDFWIFGGAQTPFGGKYFNDVWKYNISSGLWTWMDGYIGFNDPGQFGPLCSVSGTYMPSSRYETRARWTDSCGNLIFYGGASDSGNTYASRYNDLWFYNLQTLGWSVITGTSQQNLSPVYGAQGVGSFSTTPGSRRGSVAWKNYAGELFMFGGFSWSDSAGFRTIYNDLWKFTIDTTCVPVCSLTGLENTSAAVIGISPNPASDHFTVTATESIISIDIRDISGKLVFSQYYSGKDKSHSIQNDASWKKGIYLLDVNTKNKRLSGKLEIF